jgi:putative hydrolase of the HAD superfamily
MRTGFKMIRLLIFDLDNTLFDTYGQLGLQVLDKMIADMRAAGLTHEQEAFLRKNYMFSGFRIVAKQLGLSEKLKKIGMDSYKKMDLSKIRPYDDVELLKGIAQEKVLVTSGIKDVQMTKVRNMHLRALFSQVIIDEASTFENKQKIFAELMDKHHVKAEEVMVVGDNPESELAAGNNLDMVTVQIHRRKITRGKANYHIKGLKELIDILKNKGNSA